MCLRCHAADLRLDLDELRGAAVQCHDELRERALQRGDLRGRRRRALGDGLLDARENLREAPARRPGSSELFGSRDGGIERERGKISVCITM